MSKIIHVLVLYGLLALGLFAALFRNDIGFENTIIALVFLIMCVLVSGFTSLMEDN